MMDLASEYNNRALVPDHPVYFARWAAEAKAYRESAEAELDVAYGARPRNRVDMFHGTGRGGAGPVVLFIHGGYWRSLDKSIFSHIARPANEHGFDVAVAGYSLCPEVTISDIIDEMRQCCLFLSQRYGRRIVVAGHSAGGHLALWAAARDRLPAESPLRTARPLPIRGVVSLAGIADLDAYRQTGPDACGGPSTIDGLVGVQEPGGRNVFADTSPPVLLPLGDRQVVISGALDAIVPPRFGRDYAAAAAQLGDRAGSVVLEGAGHFELIDPTSASWPRVLDAFAGLLR
jgi:acetyl esterase/lipase